VNTVTLIGRLVADPELSYTPQGTAVAEFRLATDNGKAKDGSDRPADFHNIKAWERTAEVAAEYLKKGRQVAIEGRATTRSWDCSDCKHKHYRSEVVVTRLHLLGSKADGEREADRVASTVAAATGGTVLDVDDIPF